MKKKVLSMTLAVALSFSMGMTAFAAPVTMSDGNVFDADYYAQNNPDVVQVLGTDANALYSHYVNYGKTEGRLPYAPGSASSLTQTTTATQTATQGTAEAYLEAGRNALYGINGATLSFDTAYSNFMAALQLGSVDANYYLGLLCDEYGYPTEDFVKAKAYYEASGSNPYAQLGLAFLYKNGQGVAQDVAKSLSIIQTLANNGCMDAYYGLAEDAYDKGDYATAMKYYIKAANDGSEPIWKSVAMNNLAWMYENGEGVAVDKAKAIDLYTQAANLGYLTSMNNLIVSYLEGDGVSTDVVLDVYQKLAGLGYSGAMNNIAYMYYNGDGVPQNYTMAMVWLQKAADLGDAASMTNIGIMYYNGDGVAQDTSKAIEWWKKAKAAGDDTAAEYLNTYGE
jgi:hypothetical protein